MLPIRKNEFGEFDIDFVCWSEVGVESAESTFAVGDAFYLRDLARGGCAHRHDELVERVHGFDDVATDRLAYLSDPHFLIERNLNSHALRNDKRNCLKRRRGGLAVISGISGQPGIGGWSRSCVLRACLTRACAREQKKTDSR